MNFGFRKQALRSLVLSCFGSEEHKRSERPVSVALVKFSDAPVQMLSGDAKVFKNEVRAPQVSVQNQTSKPVRSIEMGWILRDNQRPRPPGRISSGRS